jgi:hypothetical protein
MSITSILVGVYGDRVTVWWYRMLRWGTLDTDSMKRSASASGSSYGVGE